MLSLRGKLFVAMIFGLLLIVTPSAATAKSGQISCNGSSKLCDRKLNEVVLPGSHNSMSAEELGWFNPNQTYSILNQLKRGARALLFDTRYGNLEPNGQISNLSKAAGHAAGAQIYLCHESCRFGASPLIPELEKVADFLKANPNEVMVIVNQDAVTPEDFAEAVDTSGLLDYVYTGPAGPWPTLGEMVNTNQRVVITAEQDAGSVPWYHEAYDGAVRETPYTFDRDTNLLTAPEQLNESCRPSTRGEGAATNNSLFLMNHWISQAVKTSGSFEPLIEWAEVVNQKDVLVKRARACEERRGFLPSILAVDFFGTGDVVGATNQLNGVAARASLRTSRLRPIVVRSGRRTVVSLAVTNAGDAPAQSVRICATAPAKLVSRPACVRSVQLLAGQRIVVRLRLNARRNASGSGAFRLRVTSTARAVNLKTVIRAKLVRKLRRR